MRAVKYSRNPIETCPYPAPFALRDFAPRRPNQRFDSRPADIRSRESRKDGVQRSLLRFIHGRLTDSRFLAAHALG
jgi:hypothetical protein